ncbi:MAG: ATP-binding protein [Deltaproteobacteria bacterium]|jgi:hypothetical protein|nr:ATP-binding protein [Deltaproteobacteria bacterium]
MEMKKLCLNGLSFKDIIQRNFLYADKTKLIYKMLNVYDYTCCFLSRPRRFGKSLLLSTIDQLFRGDRKLFDGLWIAKSDYQFERHPVLNFTMTFSEIENKYDLINGIKRKLKVLAEVEGVTIDDGTYTEMMEQLLRRISNKHGARVVILVDEYDSPVTKHISNRDLALDNRDVLHDFYESIKTNIDYIRFALVTGITRFAMTSMDSGPNNFKDISLKSQFAGICGFTPKELNKLFKNRYPRTLEKLIKNGDLGPDAGFEELEELIIKYYDGYNWLGRSNILNPFSILSFFDEKEVGTYWPLTGRPSHLTALVRERPMDFILPSQDSYSAMDVRKTSLSRLEAVPILFHSGYLTIDHPTVIEIKKNNKVKLVKAFAFRFPNEEVSLAYLADIFNDVFLPTNEYLSELTRKLPNALAEKDSVKVEKLLGDILTSISSNEHPPKEIFIPSEQPDTGYEPTKTEKYYNAILHGCFLSAGFEVHSEGSSAHGKDDIALYLNDRFRVVIELKYCHANRIIEKEGDVAEAGGEDKEAERTAKEMSAALDRAEKQMTDKDYAGPYRAAGCEVTCMAMALRNRNQVAVRFFEY